MDWFWLLYDCESETQKRKLSEAPLVAARQTTQKPVGDQMRAELDSIDDRTEQVVLPKNDLKKALNYLKNHWGESTRHLSDADLPLDNNLCEQLMPEVAMGRKICVRLMY